MKWVALKRAVSDKVKRVKTLKNHINLWKMGIWDILKDIKTIFKIK